MSQQDIDKECRCKDLNHGDIIYVNEEHKCMICGRDWSIPMPNKVANKEECKVLKQCTICETMNNIDISQNMCARCAEMVLADEVAEVTEEQWNKLSPSDKTWDWANSVRERIAKEALIKDEDYRGLDLTKIREILLEELPSLLTSATIKAKNEGYKIGYEAGRTHERNGTIVTED